MEAYTRSESHGIHAVKTTRSANFTSSYEEVWSETTYRSVIPWTNSLTGWKNPNWKSQVKAVVSATTPADGRRVEVEYSPCHAEVKGTTTAIVPGLFQPWTYFRHMIESQNIAYGDSAVEINNGTISTTAANNQAIARLYDALNSIPSPARAGEDFGEWKQTVDLFRHPLAPVRKLLTSVLKNHSLALKARNLKSLGKGLSDVYLEYQYGWKPLASSLASGLVALQNREKFAVYVPFRVTGKSSANPTTRRGGSTMIPTQTRITDEVHVKYQGVWGAESDTIPTRTVSESLGLTFREIVPTIWNLIPYSFLIDYFTNIGDIISSITVPYSNVRWCNRTIVTERKKYVSMSAVPDPAVKFIEYTVLKPGYYSISDKRFSRRAQTGLPVPEFNVDFGLSGTHWANVAALVSSKLLGIGRAQSSAMQRFPTAFMDFSGVPSIHLRR